MTTNRRDHKIISGYKVFEINVLSVSAETLARSKSYEISCKIRRCIYIGAIKVQF